MFDALPLLAVLARAMTATTQTPTIPSASSKKNHPTDKTASAKPVIDVTQLLEAHQNTSSTQAQQTIVLLCENPVALATRRFQLCIVDDSQASMTLAHGTAFLEEA
jgi:hypothetical protein